MENVLRRRAAIVRHSRISLQACVGYLMRESSKLGGCLLPSMGVEFSGVPVG
jgi:hypothetical protein